MKKFIKSKKNWAIIILAFILFIMIGNSGTASTTLEENESEISTLKSELSVATTENKELTKEISEKDEKLKEAAPWFKMNEAQQKRQEEEEKAVAKQKEKEQAAKEKAEKAEKEAKEAAKEKAEKEKAAKEKAEKEAKKREGYNTGITYDQLARTPDKYETDKVKFSGTVIQLIEGDDTVQIRFAVNGDYDRILLAEYDPSITDSRILEDDKLTLLGFSTGIITYESTMGGDISIPSMYVDEIQ